MKTGKLFDAGESWDDLWKGMPSFESEKLEPYKTVFVHLDSRKKVEEFAKLVGQKISDEKTNTSIWWPEEDFQKGCYQTGRRWIGGPRPKYPIYVISKGRWESRLTSKTLEWSGVDYRIVVEPQERDEYARVIDEKKILTLPFSNLGQGSIPARNWVWEHSISEGHDRHWILDDNIRCFERLQKNVRVITKTGAIFRAMEDFADRYENVALCGPQYHMFASSRAKNPALTLNTRIYSCILIKNDLPYRWRGRYNEDTDLSLRALKDGWSTVLFYAFLQQKIASMQLKGGNTDELYAGDGRLKMAESLREQHPDVTTITEKWGRWQHQVDYAPFEKNELRLRDDVEIRDGNDEYGMTLEIDDAVADESKVEEKISATEWTNLLNAGGIDEAPSIVLKRFGYKIHELPKRLYPEALSLVRKNLEK